jgi:cytoskeletal protein RodZ
MKNQKLNHIILWAIAIILGFAMNSCGARKAEKNRNSEAQKVEITDNTLVEKKVESNTKVIEKTTVDDKNKTKTTETSYKPVDPTKEASVTTPDGKKHKLTNAEILIKETEHENNIKTDNSRNSEEFHKSEVSEVSESGTKTDTKKTTEEIKVEREEYSIWNWLWLLIPLGLILVWLNKSKIITWAKNIW